GDVFPSLIPPSGGIGPENRGCVWSLLRHGGKKDAGFFRVPKAIVMNRVLVTGAKGCIGAWTLRALLDDGHEVVALDLPGNMHRLDLILGSDLAKVTLVEGDILDAPGLIELVKRHEITHIVHLAALQVPAAKANPTLGAQVNVVGTVNVFEA